MNKNFINIILHKMFNDFNFRKALEEKFRVNAEEVDVIATCDSDKDSGIIKLTLILDDRNLYKDLDKKIELYGREIYIFDTKNPYSYTNETVIEPFISGLESHLVKNFEKEKINDYLINKYKIESNIMNAVIILDSLIVHNQLEDKYIENDTYTKYLNRCDRLYFDNMKTSDYNKVWNDLDIIFDKVCEDIVLNNIKTDEKVLDK